MNTDDVAERKELFIKAMLVYDKVQAPEEQFDSL